jgi:hypothetical protein
MECKSFSKAFPYKKRVKTVTPHHNTTIRLKKEIYVLTIHILQSRSHFIRALFTTHGYHHLDDLHHRLKSCDLKMNEQQHHKQVVN